jgi:peptide/nickel transport system permease protein
LIKFLVKRTVYGLMVLAGVITVVFLLFNVLPGDPARMMMGQRADEESLKAINKDLGLDKPLSVQFVMYVNDLMPISIHDKNPNHYLYLDDTKYDYKTIYEGKNKVLVLKIPFLRRSYQSKRKVSEILLDYIPETAVLAISSIIIATFLGILFGIISALNVNSVIDRFFTFVSILGMSIPSFLSAMLFSWIFGYLLADYTGLNPTGSLYDIDVFEGEIVVWKNIVLPALALGIRPVATIMQLTRGSMLDVMSQDFIRTARAKGLKNLTIIIKHALKNALNPVVTAISGMFASLLAGALFVEAVFAWKGLGWVLYDALTKYDLPIVMGGVLITSTFFVLINIVVDVTYGILDPRVRIK